MDMLKKIRARVHPEVRSLAIFGSYLALGFGLATSIVSSIQERYAVHRRNGRAVFLFTVLAALSLATTWSYMIAFFSNSYVTWAGWKHVQTPTTLWGANGLIQTHPDGFPKGLGLQLGRWLSEVELFKGAWQVACSTKARFWWTNQIFLVTTIWSLFLTVEGSRRNVPSLWAFLLLGELVSVSFAMNLSFLTVLLHPVQRQTAPPALDEKSKDAEADEYITKFRKLVLVVVPVAMSLAFTVLIPQAVHSPDFLTFLAVPHVLLFFPLFFSAKSPVESDKSYQEDALTYRSWTFISTCAAVLLSFGRATLALANTKGGPFNVHSLVNAFHLANVSLFEHPAVSSVGFDVIFSYMSAGAWILTRAVLKEPVDTKTKTN